MSVALMHYCAVLKNVSALLRLTAAAETFFARFSSFPRGWKMAAWVAFRWESATTFYISCPTTDDDTEAHTATAEIPTFPQARTKVLLGPLSSAISPRPKLLVEYLNSLQTKQCAQLVGFKEGTMSDGSSQRQSKIDQNRTKTQPRYP